MLFGLDGAPWRCHLADVNGPAPMPEAMRQAFNRD